MDLSPATFVESSEHPGVPDVIRRKDDIIRARNAQIGSLYEQLHTRGAWEVWHRLTAFAHNQLLFTMSCPSSDKKFQMQRWLSVLFAPLLLQPAFVTVPISFFTAINTVP